jgi:hypothetical protein
MYVTQGERRQFFAQLDIHHGLMLAREQTGTGEFTPRLFEVADLRNGHDLAVTVMHHLNLHRPLLKIRFHECVLDNVAAVVLHDHVVDQLGLIVR